MWDLENLLGEPEGEAVEVGRHVVQQRRRILCPPRLQQLARLDSPQTRVILGLGLGLGSESRLVRTRVKVRVRVKEEVHVRVRDWGRER